jgi:signal transduction histidine kinase
LLSNALTHDDSPSPVIVTAKCGDDGFELSVANKGKKIPDEVMEHLFKPFSRGSDKSEQGSLGLGLYISSEIARAHNGTLDVISTDDETRFTLHMPVSA